MTKSFFLIALLISLCILGANAQTINRLPVLEEMFRLADENNRRIKAQTSAVYEAEMGVKTAKNALLPSIEASLSLAYNADGLIINRDFSNSFTAHIPHFGNNFALEVSQIIYAGGAIKNGIEIAKMHSQITSLNAENSRQEVRFLITGNYLELCKLKNQLQVFESHVEQTKNMLDKMHRRYNEGVALQNDITRYELQLQNLYYSKIQLSNMVHILNDRLVAALGMPPSTVIAADTFYIHPFLEENETYWQNTAMTFATPIKIANAALEMNIYKEKNSRAERLPQIALFAVDYLDGPITIEIPAINKNFNIWAVGVGIKYNIGNLYKPEKIRQSRLAVQKAKDEKAVAEEEILLSAQASFIHYKEAFSLLETKKKSVELARINYDITVERYENGLSLITDLLDAAAQKLDAELQETNARINITYNYYKLKFVSGTL